jgi:hypothetical protein
MLEIILGATAALGWGAAIYFRFKELIHLDELRYERSLRDNDLLQWTKTEERLVSEIALLRAKELTDAGERQKLVSMLVSIKAGGPVHGQHFEEPESYSLDDPEEHAEWERRKMAMEGTDPEVAAMVRSRLADEIPEFEPPETM